MAADLLDISHPTLMLNVRPQPSSDIIQSSRQVVVLAAIQCVYGFGKWQCTGL